MKIFTSQYDKGQVYALEVISKHGKEEAQSVANMIRLTPDHNAKFLQGFLSALDTAK